MNWQLEYYWITKYINDLGLQLLSDSYVGENLRTLDAAGGNERLFWLNQALKGLSSSLDNAWVNERFRRLVEEPNSSAIKSACVAEIVAGGIASDVFSSLKNEPPKKRKHPDFLLEAGLQMEVYCPQEHTSVDKLLEESQLNQFGSIKISVCHTVTGNDPKALSYAANMTISRIGSKRDKDQTVNGVENILWVDLMNGLNLSCIDSLPCRSVNKVDSTTVGCFGIWHAFYGEVNKSVFPRDRTNLKFLEPSQNYLQHRYTGLFRERNSLSAAILLMHDGIVLFENPWTTFPLTEANKKQLTKLFRFRPEFSFFSAGSDILDSSYIENELKKLAWLFCD